VAAPQLSSVVAPVCSWSTATRKFEVYLDPAVLAKLGADSWVAFKKLPRRGLEIGGVLLGRIDAGDDTTTFWIEGFQDVESDHQAGPSYVLSRSDFARLQQTVAKHGSANLGIYRSQTRSEGLALEQSDFELFDKSFGSESIALFLIIGPVPGLAAIYFRTDGNLSYVHEFAFPSPMKTMLAHRQGGYPAQASTPLPQAELNAGLNDVAQVVPPKQSALESGFKRAVLQIKELGLEKRRWARPAAIALLSVLALVGVIGALRRGPAPDRAPEYVHLTVQPSESSLRLMWDRNAPMIRSANHAILHIQDGNQQRDTTLPPAQLAAGSITYQPQSSEVNFRLEVFLSRPAGIGLIEAVNFAPDGAGTRTAPAAKHPISVRPSSH
jgi:hypothetical protein